MLKLKLFKWFAGLVLIFGTLSIVLGIWMIQRRVVQEAQTRVRYDLSSAWAVYNSQLRHLESITQLSAEREPFIAACKTHGNQGEAARQNIQDMLGKICMDYKLDFLTLVAPDGEVLARAKSPFKHGDFRRSCPLVAKALSGQAASGTALLSPEEIRLEASGLADKSFLALQQTPHARATPRTSENRGMAMMAAVPIMQNGRVLGALYAGTLLNRNAAFVDKIQSMVFGDQNYNGTPVGTVTVFLADTRVATTVRLANGNRALGTRVSQEVADRVLDNSQSWVDRAFVVKDWYLTAYDPIENCEGYVVGMLYVGTLEAPFREHKWTMIYQYSILLALALLAAVVMAMFIAGRIAQPLHRLSEAANKMRHGQKFQPVTCNNTCNETAGLIEAFNEMALTLSERERQLTEANDNLGEANESLQALNSHYMETLQFVSHELNSPLSAITNYAYLLKKKLLGPLTEKQDEAMEVVSANLKRVTEMTRHYLNLARIEQGEIQPTLTHVSVREEIITPVLESLKGELHAYRMHVEDLIDPKLILHVDLNMMREVFENLFSNAIKYGRQGGRVTLKSSHDDSFGEISVRNEGDGIPPERLGELFNKFSRLETSEAKQSRRGTGLGLFICRKIIESHGGTITAHSKVGSWTEFRCRLPLASAHDAEKKT